MPPHGPRAHSSGDLAPQLSKPGVREDAYPMAEITASLGGASTGDDDAQGARAQLTACIAERMLGVSDPVFPCRHALTAYAQGASPSVSPRMDPIRRRKVLQFRAKRRSRKLASLAAVTGALVEQLKAGAPLDEAEQQLHRVRAQSAT